MASDLACLNRAVALERVGGDEDLLQEIAALFLEEYPKLLESIRHAVEISDARGLEHAAHSLKGSVGNFGADEAYNAAFALELLGRKCQMDVTARSLRVLEESLDRLKIDLQTLAEAGA